MNGIINESSSVIRVNNNSRLVYLSSTTTPGQLVTIVDITGVRSPTNQITVSTVGPISAPPLFIQQGYGYITLFSVNSNTWVPVNCNSFPTPSSVSYLALDSQTVRTSSITAYSYVSSINTITVRTDVSVSSVTDGIGYINNLYINNYQQYISTSVTDPKLVNIGLFEQYGSTQALGALNVRGSISTLGNFNVLRNFSTKEAVMYLGGDLTTAGSLRGQSGVDARVQGVSSFNTGIFNLDANFASTVNVSGSLSTNMISTFYTVANQYNVTSSLIFGPSTQSIQYTTNFLVIDTPATISSISTNIIDSYSIATSNLFTENFGEENTLQTLTMSSATIENPNGSLLTSSIIGNELLLGDMLNTSNLEVQNETYTNTIQIDGAGSFLSSYQFLTDSYTVSSFSTIGANVTTDFLFTVNDNFDNFTDLQLRIFSSFLFESSATLLSAKNTFMNNIGGTILSHAVETGSSVMAGSISADTFISPGPIYFEGQSTVSLENKSLDMLITGDFIQTSTLEAMNALIGATVAYSTINPSTPWMLASTFQMNTRFTNQNGLGTYFNHVAFKSASDETAYYSIINPSTQAPSFLSSPYINTIIGTGVNGYNGDGIASNVKIGRVIGQPASDSDQTIYFGDNTIGWKLRQVSKSGLLTTLAGKYRYFYGDGKFPLEAALGTRLDVSLLGPGSVMVTDISNVRFRYVDAQPILTTLIGSGTVGYSGDGGDALAATFNNPQMSVTDLNSNVYIADTLNNVIRLYSQTASTVTTYAGTGVAGNSGDEGPAISAQFASPYGVAVDPTYNFLFLTDLSNCVVRYVDSAGIVHKYAGNYTNGFSGDGGPAIDASLSYPRGIAIDGSNNVYICDTGNSRIRRIDYTTGEISTIAGNGIEGYSGNNGPGYLASLSSPTGLTVDANGNLFIADTNNNCIRFLNVNNGILTTLIGQPPRGGYLGNNTFAQFSLLSTPTQVVYDRTSAYLYIADSGNSLIRLVDTTTNVIYDYVGNRSPIYFGNQTGLPEVVFGSIESVASDLENNIYISDGAANLIRKIDISTMTISTVVGTGVAGFTGDGIGALEEINAPRTLVSDMSNNILFCDTENHRVRKYISATQELVTLVGTGDASDYGDGGPASMAALNYPKALTVDMSGNLFIGDSSNYRIRRVDATSGIITTFAGTGLPGLITAGGVATETPIGYVNAVTTDISNNLYLTDTPTSGIWQINGGLFQAFTNISTPTFFGDGGPALNALLSTPTGVFRDSSNNFVICDADDYRIRRTYTYGSAQNPIYLNMNMNFTNYYATTGAANIIINGNTVATFNTMSSNANYILTDTNVYNYPLQGTNPVLGDFTPYLQITQTGNTGYMKLNGNFWVNAIPGQEALQNIVDSNSGIVMNTGFMRFPYTLEGISINNQKNDASTRSLFYTGSLNNASDPALKEDIEAADLSRCYKIIEDLPLRNYSYIGAFQSTFQLRDRRRLGFLTTEVSKEFPKSITATDLWSSTIQTLDTTQIKYAHIGATKQLMEQVSTLEGSVAELVQIRNLLRLAPTQRNVIH